jgi:hypothetical protein
VYQCISVSVYQCISVSVYQCTSVPVYQCISVSVYQCMECLNLYSSAVSCVSILNPPPPAAFLLLSLSVHCPLHNNQS